ncbi:MAG: phosphoribosylformylglycinamidine cyclo-ligase [Actinomycetota bacterium]
MGARSYEEAGVRGQHEALSAVRRYLSPTFDYPDAEVLTSFGHYASVLKVSDDLALAICTDGVGSKTIVASAVDRYDTVGIDCMAMNVNDLICVGARPVALVDYLGVHTLDEGRAAEILKGLGAAAAEAGVAVVGGEIAQLPEVIGSDGTVVGDERAFDLVGTCVGVLRPDELILGEAVAAGDAVIGLASSGLHSNGYTLARRVLLDEGGYGLDEHIGALGCTLGEELLRPTRIYVRAVVGLWEGGLETRGLAHITGDGVANLCRLGPHAGFLLDGLPRAQPIFGLIQETGGIGDAEMFRVFNMGIGFVVVVPGPQERAALKSLAALGYDAMRIGSVTDQAGQVWIRPHGLVATLRDGEAVIEPG